MLHRWAYQTFNGEIPKNYQVRHTCDNKICINPNHLLVGTNQDNVNDKVNRNRQIRNENSPMSKLTNSQVKEIKRMINAGIKNTVIAKYFNVDASNISKIKHGETWRNI